MTDLAHRDDPIASIVPLAQAEAWEAELAELSAHLACATWRELTLIRRLEPTGPWAQHGATSYAGWLSWRVGLTPSAARERIRVARALGRLPRIDRALAEGRISFSKVRALARVARAENEETLLEMALHATAAHLETICRGLARVERDASGDVVEPAPIERWARQRAMDDGSVRIEAQLAPDEAALVWRALEVARGIGARARELTDGATALVRIAESFLAHGEGARTGAERTEVIVHLEADRLGGCADALAARLEDGAQIGAETLRRVACDCAVRAVVEDEQGSPLDVGRRRRLVPPRLRRALELRDRHCRFPGCTHRAWLDAHHAEHWLHGGGTDLENLVLLCPSHHRLVHEGGFTLAMEDGEPIVRAPDGSVLPRVPATVLVAHDVLAAWRDSAETPIDDRTILPWWDGEPPDVSACIEAARVGRARGASSCDPRRPS